MANVNIVDERTPVEPAPEPTFAERYPLGAFVAYNGPSADGKRKRAVITQVDESTNSLVVLDGPDLVTVSGDDVANVVVLANSANAFAERVSVKARALGKAHNWCGVAEEAVNELNNRAPDYEPERQRVTVEVTATTRYDLLTTRHVTTTTPEELIELLKSRFYLYVSEFDRTYFRVQNSVGNDSEVAIRVVDASPTPAEAS